MFLTKCLLHVAQKWQQWRQHGVAACAVAAAADSRMPLLTPAFFVFFTKCLLHVAQKTEVAAVAAARRSGLRGSSSS